MKYIILEIQGNYAAACSEDGRFVKLKNNGYEVGQEIKAELRVRNIPRVAAAACLAFLIVSGGVSAWAYLTPFSYISIDVNPSVQMSANFFDRVLSSTAMNDDGEVILGDLDLRNKTIQDAVLLTVQEMIEQDYISSGEETIRSLFLPIRTIIRTIKS